MNQLSNGVDVIYASLAVIKSRMGIHNGFHPLIQTIHRLDVADLRSVGMPLQQQAYIVDAEYNVTWTLRDLPEYDVATHQFNELTKYDR